MPLFAWVAIVVSSIAAMPGNVLPVLTTLIGSHHHLNEATVGYLISVNTFAGLLTSAAGPYWIGRVRYRPLLAVCFALQALTLLGLGFSRGLPALLAVQVVGGVSAMVIASVTQTIFAELPRPERAFGIKISTDMTFAGLFLVAVPVARLGLPGFVALLAIPFALSAIASRLLPEKLDDRHVRRIDVGAIRRGLLGGAPPAVWATLIAIAVFNVGGVGVWTFVGHFATGAGLSEDGVANAVSVGLFSGIVGALGAAALAGRAGIAPEMVTGIGFLLSMPAFALARNPAEFTAANVALNVCWNFVGPFLVGIVARRDATRRLNSLIPAAVMVGGIVGPPLTGTLLHETTSLATALTMMAIAAPSIVAYAILKRWPPATAAANPT